MATFTYVARTVKTDHRIEGEIEAESETAAAHILTERGLHPLDVKAKRETPFLSRFTSRVPTKHKVIFSRQLATLVNAGLPLVQSLNSVKNQTTNKQLKVVMGHIVTEVEAGTPLATAMSHHPRIFDNVYVSLVAAGETSGTLDKSLERLATQQEKDAQILSKVRGALVYPSIVLLVLFGVITFMLTTVLPSVQSLYQDLPGVQLPFVTRLLLAISHALTHFWWLWIIIVVLAVVVGGRYFREGPGRSTLDRLKMRLPALGPLYMKLYMARFARIGGTLVEAGVPIIQMLNTTADTVGNMHVTAAIKKATEKVKGGKPLSDSLEGDPNFTDLVPSMIRIGEQSGSLDSMLSRLADYYENEVDNEVKSISTIIEPVLIVAVGVIALIVVAAVLLPIYSLAGKTTSL